MTSSTTSSRSDDVTMVGAARYRLRQLVRQHPPHDSDVRHCTSLKTDEEREELLKFDRQRRLHQLGRGQLFTTTNDDVDTTLRCNQCDVTISCGELVVRTGHTGWSVVWHWNCFVCVDCRQLLIDLVYFYSARHGTVYCGRHHAQSLRPRCQACDELIFAEQCTEAAGRCYHVDHFVCAECQCQLAGRRYVLLADRPYCADCFHAVYADFCSSCGQIIAVQQRHVVHANRKWHDSCFRCENCGRTLLGRKCLLFTEGSVFGSVFCSDSQCANQRQRKLLPVDSSWYSTHTDSRNDDVIDCDDEFQRQTTEPTCYEQQLSNAIVRLVTRQTTV